MLDIVTVNLALNTLIFWVALRIYVVPRFTAERWETFVLPILLLHSGRHLGLMFLFPGATYVGLPAAFSVPAAAGDIVAAFLAAIAATLILCRARGRIGAVWLFNVWGTLDLAAAITLATLHDAGPFMGPSYWIPAFWVPTLLATHGFTFMVLVRVHSGWQINLKQNNMTSTLG